MSYEFKLSPAVAVVAAKFLRQQGLQPIPTRQAAAEAFDNLSPEAQDYIAQRAAEHGLEPVDLMVHIPEELWGNSEQVIEFMTIMDVSHVVPQATHPHLSSNPNNVVLEARDVNRARGAQPMSADEVEAAAEGADAAAQEFANGGSAAAAETAANDATRNAVDYTWWDINDVWHEVLGVAETLGYSGAYIPKEDWKQLMGIVSRFVKRVNTVDGMPARMKAARMLCSEVKGFFRRNANHLATAFILGVCTLSFPPLQLLVEAWGFIGLGCVAVHLLKKLTSFLEAKFGSNPFLQALSASLQCLGTVLTSIHKFLSSMKDLLVKGATKVMDLILPPVKKAVKAAAKAAKTVVKSVVDCVVPAVQKVFRAAKNIVSGFFGWIGGLFGSKRPAYA